MNNNRGNNNNRRRGRGNNRQQGGQQVNRIDSRARGNAPQMLEKYRKLAHDAHLNGDRVSEEYYLQFADHYFRVIADTRQRQEEQRTRRDERWQEGGEPFREESEESGEFGNDSDYAPYGRDPSREGPRESGRTEDFRDRGDNQRERPDAQRERADAPPAADAEEESQEGRSGFEPASNPFTRDDRGGRGLRPRRDDRRPRRERDDAGGDDGGDRSGNRGTAQAEQQGLDPSSLPPAIGATRVEREPELPMAAEEEPAPKPRRGRPRKVKPAEDGEPVAASGSE